MNASAAPTSDRLCAFLVTLTEQGDGEALDDPRHTFEVRATDREDARKQALRALRELHPQHRTVWA